MREETTPVPREDAVLRSVPELQAEQGVIDEKKPGAETPGNTE